MSFERIVGHEQAIRLLKGQLAQGRLAHAYLFAGLEGIGKGALALEFTKALQCELGKDDSCDACEPCRRVAAGNDPDVITVAAAEDKHDVGIDQIRALEAALSLTPHGGRWKVGIVDEAERMTEESAHGLLKLLEEPPERSVIVLLSTALHRLPATLVSRCHVVRCSAQGIERVAAVLRGQAGPSASLQAVLPAEAARTVAIASSGRLGLALRFHETGRLAEKNAALNQMLAALRQGSLEIPMAKITRREVEENLEWYAGWWRDLLVLSLGGDPAWVIHQDRLDELKRVIAKQSQGDRPESLLDRVEQTYAVHDAVQRNANLRNALAVLLSHHG